MRSCWFHVSAGFADLLTLRSIHIARTAATGTAQASLRDLMGPWPWYILAGAQLAIAMFAALDVPFRERRGDSVGPALQPGPLT